MGPSKKSSLFFVCSLLFLIASCGEKSDSSTSREINSICAGLDCLTSAKWKINLLGKEFPNKSRVDINGLTILNECMPKQKYFIDRDAEPQRIEIDSYYVPRAGDLKIEVADLGVDCETETIFISNPNVAFEVNNLDESSEVVINL